MILRIIKNPIAMPNGQAKIMAVLFLIAFGLFFGCPKFFRISKAQAAITYFGSASNPADNSNNTNQTIAITPPSNMQAGDFVIITGIDSALGSQNPNITISNAGGQTWTSLTETNDTYIESRIFYARYNGTWSANPSVYISSKSWLATDSMSAIMHVFRPTATCYQWATDVSEVITDYTASPTVLSGITTLTDGALVFASWNSSGTGTWGSLTSGWSTPGSAQYRNGGGTLYKISNTSAYKVQATAGATGDVQKTNSAGTDGMGHLIAFKEYTYTTTVGDGTDPSNSTIGPGASATEIDRFTLQTDTGTDSVTGMTITLGPTGAYNNIGTVAVQNTGGTTTYCTTSSVTSNTVSLSCSGLSATTSSTEYKIMITPKTHANMPAVPGASYATTATVTALTDCYNDTYNDTDSAAITVDNASPGAVTSTSGFAGDTEVFLYWTNPSDSDFTTGGTTIVLRRTGGAVTDVPVEGTTYTVGNTIGSSTVICVNSGSPPATGCTDSSLTNSTAYYYKIFTQDSRGNYNAGTTPTGSPFTPVAGTLAADIVDASGNSVSSPSIVFGNKNFSWTSQQSTGTFGISSQKIRLSNSRITRTWSLTLAATSGASAKWVSGSYQYDYDDTAANGRLTVDPSGGTITPESGCSTTGVSKGSSAYFSSGSSITLLSASGSADKYCYWDFTGIGMTQDIPASQQGGTYSISLTLTAS